ncbi:hypothetical protein MRX96_035262 [Rhipicephalus microplus]
MADGNNEPSHKSEALLSDLNEAANHVDSTPQTCGPSPTVKAASLRLTRARRRLARKGSYPTEKPEETPTSRPQTRPHPRRQQPPKRPAATQRNRGGRAAAITKPAAISTATKTDEFPSQSPPRKAESSGASSSSPTTSSSSSSSWEHETPATSPSSESESVFRFTSSGSPSCAECPAEETTEHILLHCPGYNEQRRRLFDAYGRLGLPHVSLNHLRFPQAPRSSLMRAFEALLEFFGDAALIARL